MCKPNSLPKRVLSALVVGCLWAGSGCIQVDAELPLSCFLEPDLAFEAPESSDGGSHLAVEDSTSTTSRTVVMSRSFIRSGLEEIPEAIEDAGADAWVSLAFVEVVAVRGRESFETIAYVGLRMSTVTAVPTLRPVTIAACDGVAGCDTSSRSIVLSAEGEPDLLPYLARGDLEFTLEVRDDAATLGGWSADVDVCLSSRATASYGL